MIIKNYEPNKINLNKTKFVLLYGENTGAKEDFTKIILKVSAKPSVTNAK